MLITRYQSTSPLIHAKQFLLVVCLDLSSRVSFKFLGKIKKKFLNLLLKVELALIMERLYGGVCYAGIDTDPEFKYPKGAARVTFSNQHSYVAAVNARFVQLQKGDIDKRVIFESLFILKYISIESIFLYKKG